MTLYFQIQFLKLKCTENSKNTIKSALKSERKKKRFITEKKYQGPEKKIQGAKERHYRDSESKRQYRKRKNQENPEQERYYKRKEIPEKS